MYVIDNEHRESSLLQNIMNCTQKVMKVIDKLWVILFAEQTDRQMEAMNDSPGRSASYRLLAIFAIKICERR